MWGWLVRLLVGPCQSCREKQARIEAQERRITDLLDRLMSRDYSHVAFVRAQTTAVREQAKTGTGEIEDELAGVTGDGLDS